MVLPSTMGRRSRSFGGRREQMHPSRTIAGLCARAQSGRGNLALSQAGGIEESRLPEWHRAWSETQIGNGAAAPEASRDSGLHPACWPHSLELYAVVSKYHTC